MTYILTRIYMCIHECDRFMSFQYKKGDHNSKMLEGYILAPQDNEI